MGIPCGGPGGVGQFRDLEDDRTLTCLSNWVCDFWTQWSEFPSGLSSGNKAAKAADFWCPSTYDRLFLVKLCGDLLCIQIAVRTSAGM